MFYKYGSILVAVVPGISDGGCLSDLQPQKHPDKKAQQAPAPVLAHIPAPPCCRSPCQPLVVLVHFQGASPITPRLRLLPESQSMALVPPQALPQKTREPQPSPMLPLQSDQESASFRRPSSDYISSREHEDMSKHPAMQDRIWPAPAISFTRLESLSSRPLRKNPATPDNPERLDRRAACHSQLRMQLVPESPGWPSTQTQRRLPKEPELGQHLPQTLLPIRQSSRARPEKLRLLSPLSPRELRQGRPSPHALSMYRLMPPSKFPQRTPSAPLPLFPVHRSQPRVQLVPSTSMVLAGNRPLSEIPLLRHPQALSPESRARGSRQPKAIEGTEGCVLAACRASARPHSPQTVTPSPGSRSECLLTGLRQRPRSANPSQRYGSRSASKTTAGTPGPGSYDPEPVSFDMYMPQHTRQEKRARMEPYKDLYKSVTKAESRGSSRQSLETCSTQSIFWPSGTLD